MNSAPKNGYEDWYTVRTHEIDFRKVLTLPSLMMLMQEASMHNALNLKISIWDHGMDNLSWVLLRKEISVKKLPTLAQRVKVITYPAGFQRIFAYRDFWVYDEKGDEIAHAASTWTLLDLENRKISKIPEGILALDIPDPENRLTRPAVRISSPEQYETGYTYQIRHFDLDWNHHVNNIVLSKLMLQAIPEDVFKNRMLSDFTIHIKSECYMDELVKVGLSLESDHLFYHQIKGNDGRVVAVGRSKWRQGIL